MAMAVMVWSSVPLAMLPLRAGDAPLTLGQPTAPAAEDAAAALFARQFDDALRIVNDSLAALRGSEEGNDKRIRTLLILKGQALYGLGRSQEAIDALAPFAQSLDAAEPLVSAGADWNGLNVLADCFMAVDRWQDALACLSRARSMLAADTSGDGGSQAINSATTLGKIGTAHARLGEWDQARAAFGEQVESLAAEPDGGGAYLAAAHNGLGLVADNLADHATAARHYALAAQIYEKAFGLDHPYTKRALTTLGRVQSILGNKAESDAIAARLAAVNAVPTSITPTLQTSPPTAPPPAPAKTPLAPIGWPVVAGAGAALLLGLMAMMGVFRRGGGDGDAAEGPDPEREAASAAERDDAAQP
jgi:tetratricopeptide (TPR) repeat protein